jgi:RimJ/RimL family protein N-acetyltransferase
MNEDYTILTPRLRLEAPSLDELYALLCGERAALAARVGAIIPEDWPYHQLRESLPIIMAEMEREPGEARWLWLVIEPVNSGAARVIGDLGFHGPFQDGAAAEIGYVLDEAARGRGYAAEAAAALIAWVFAHTGVSEVIAQIEPDNTASLRVAAKLGMSERTPRSPGYRCLGVARPQS